MSDPKQAFFQEIRKRIRNHPEGGVLEVMDAILKLFNMLPPSHSWGQSDAWMEKFQKLIVAIDFCVHSAGMETEKQKIAQLQEKIEKNRHEKKALEDTIQNLETTLGLENKTLADLRALLEQLQSIEFFLSANESVRVLRDRLKDDQQFCVSLPQWRKEYEKDMEKALQHLTEAEKIVQVISEEFERHTREIQERNGR